MNNFQIINSNCDLQYELYYILSKAIRTFFSQIIRIPIDNAYKSKYIRNNSLKDNQDFNHFFFFKKDFSRFN